MSENFILSFISETEWTPNDLLKAIQIINEATKSYINVYSIATGKRREENDIDDIIPIIQKNSNEYISIWITNHTDNNRYSLDINSDSLKLSKKRIRFDSEWYYHLFDDYNDPNGVNEEQILNAVRKIYSILKPFHGYLATGDDPNNYFVTAHCPSTSEYDRRYEFLLNRINLFDPRIVDGIGRDRLKSLKAHVLEQFDDGGMLVVPVALNDKEFDKKYFRSDDFRVPLDRQTVEWYSKIAGEKIESTPLKKNDQKGFRGKAFGKRGTQWL